MKIGLLGLIMSDLSDVNYNTLRWAYDLGFHGVGAHLTVPADTISADIAANARSAFDSVGMPFLQLWGPYPSIISPDEDVRQSGVDGARALVRLAAQMGIPESGVRPTSLSPRGDWWPHPDNFKPETEARLIRSLCEILETAEAHDITIVLETHTTTTLNTPETIRRIIEQTGSQRLKLNLDPCNFMGDLQTVYHQAALFERLFSQLTPYIATVHLKDFLLEDRFVVHISETVIGTGLMEWDILLPLVNQHKPDAYVVIEHLPINLIPLAKRNLTDKIKALGLPLG
jgi:sugar phosphate isomerase/epimerase